MGTELQILDIDNAINLSGSVCIKDAIKITDALDFDICFPPCFQVAEYMVVNVIKGEIKGMSNGVQTHYVAPALVILQPNQRYSFRSASDDAEGSLIIFSKEFSEQLNIIHEFELNAVLCGQSASELDSEARCVMQEYITQLKRVASLRNNPFQAEAALHITRAFFYGVGAYYYHLQKKHTNSRQKELSEKFLQLISQYGATERQLEFYANKMHLSSKYIALVVRNETGKTVSKWIEDAVIKEAKRLLLETNMTVQQIAHRLNFHDQAYFGAYFKRLVGTSPNKFRTTAK